jgi:hypothetical protein
MTTTVHVIMPTVSRRAVCQLCTGQDAHALLRTERPSGQPPAVVRHVPASQAEKLLAGGHKGVFGHLDKVDFVKAPSVVYDYQKVEQRVLAMLPDGVAKELTPYSGFGLDPSQA